MNKICIFAAVSFLFFAGCENVLAADASDYDQRSTDERSRSTDEDRRSTDEDRRGDDDWQRSESDRRDMEPGQDSYGPHGRSRYDD